jgi:hypothetical protein
LFLRCDEYLFDGVSIGRIEDENAADEIGAHGGDVNWHPELTRLNAAACLVICRAVELHKYKFKSQNFS